MSPSGVLHPSACMEKALPVLRRTGSRTPGAGQVSQKADCVLMKRPTFPQGRMLALCQPRKTSWSKKNSNWKFCFILSHLQLCQRPQRQGHVRVDVLHPARLGHRERATALRALSVPNLLHVKIPKNADEYQAALGRCSHCTEDFS